MGLAAPRIAQRFGTSWTAADPFFIAVVSIDIGVLFVSITALVPVHDVVSILIPTRVVALIFMLFVRPLVALGATAYADLTKQERTFIIITFRLPCMDFPQSRWPKC